MEHGTLHYLIKCFGVLLFQVLIGSGGDTRNTLGQALALGDRFVGH